MNQVRQAKKLSRSALATVEQIFPILTGKVFNYASEEDFEKVWSFRSLPADRIVILWERTASDLALSPINAADCLSPIDWAAAYVTSLSGDTATWPEVLILDLAPKTNSKVSTVAHFETLRPQQLPWLALCKNPSLRNLVEWLGGTRSFSVGKGGERYSHDCRAGLSRLLREIRLSLTEVNPSGTYDRHSISNIVGPLLLLGNVAKPTLHSTALLRLLRSCELCSAKTGDDSGRQLPELGGDLQILLVDDQAEHGWSEWLRQCLPKAEVKYLTSPGRLIDELTKQLTTTRTKDLRFQFRLPELANASNPILFLDLRLFSGNPTEERKFYRENLLPLIDHFTDREDLAWPSFSKADKRFTESRKVVEGNEPFALESLVHHELLTWFPRIIALADMSLPIVIFSSTGLRRLFVPFASTRNIFTQIEKPRLGADLSDIATLAANQLRRQIEEVRAWLKPRFRLNRLVAPLNANGYRSESALDKGGREPSGFHAVVYMDETGSAPRLTFGALVVLYAGSDEEREIDRALSAQYGASIRGGHGKDWLRKNCSTVVESLSEHLSVSPTFLKISSDPNSFFNTDLSDSDELHDENVADNLWRQMLRQTIEASLYVVARNMLPGDSQLRSFSVRAPTRVLPAKNKTLRHSLFGRWGINCERVGPDAALEDAVESLCNEWRWRNRFGVWWKDFIDLPGLLRTLLPDKSSDEMIRYFNYDGPRPVVEEVMKLYRSSIFSPTADLVRAFSINSHSASQGVSVPLAHFMVDALLDRQNTHVKEIVIARDSYGLALETMLEANRLFLSNRLVEAIECYLGLSGIATGSDVQNRVVRELGWQLLDLFTGDDYRTLATLPALRIKRHGGVPDERRGIVISRGQPPMPHVRADDGTVFFAMPPVPAVGTPVKFKLGRDRSPGKPFVARNVQPLIE